MIRLILTAIACVVPMGAHASGGWVSMPSTDIEFPDAGDWTSLPNGAVQDEASGMIAVPLIMVEDGIPAHPEEREVLARQLATTMAQELEANYSDVTNDVALRDDGFGILLSGYADSALHGGGRALTLVSVVATPTWAGAMTLVVPESAVLEQGHRADAIVRGWRRQGATASEWYSQQLFTMNSPRGFVLDSRVAMVASLLRPDDGASLTAVSGLLRPRSARGRIGVAAITAGLGSLEGIDTEQIVESAGEHGVLFDLHQTVRRTSDDADIDLFVRVVETPDRSAGFLMLCSDGLCDAEREAFDAAFETFEWQ